MTKARGFALAVLSLSMLAASQQASAVSAAGGLRAGTLGLGGEVTFGLTDRLNLRVPFNTFSYNYDTEEDGIDYEGDLKLRSFGAQIDVHPFKGSFYLSAGLFSNGNKLDLLASDPSGEEVYEVGDGEYRSSTSDPLAIRGKLDFKSTAPYLGLGWGNAIQGDSNFYFRFELGAYFQGAGKVAATASGTAVDVNSGESFDVNGSSTEAMVFQQNLEEERQDLESDIGDYKIYPAISFGLGYRFKF